jgi:TonB family protein
MAQTAPEMTLALDPILVEGTIYEDGPMSVIIDPEWIDLPPALDGGEMLRSVPGVTSGRMGGLGLERVIRGQQQNQINVIDAGSFTYGACPNRMDPPTATASFIRADEIIVQKGYAIVTNGPGGSGGAVILKRNPPVLDEEPTLTGAVGGGIASNGRGQDVAGRFTYNLGRGLYVQGSADMSSAGNYKDGDGNEVRSSYDQRSLGATVGYVGDGVDLAFDVEYDLTEDVLFPGAGMDSPFDETYVYRLRGGVDVSAGALNRIEGTLYYSTVDHVMDNYSLRPVGAMAMRVPATSDTVGGKLEGQLSFGTTDAQIGVDYQSNNRNATAYMGMPAMIPMLEAENPGRAMFLMWPDVTVAQTGIFAQSETTLSTATTLIAGLRYDYVNAKAGKANIKPAPVPVPPVSAAQLARIAEVRLESRPDDLMRAPAPAKAAPQPTPKQAAQQNSASSAAQRASGAGGGTNAGAAKNSGAATASAGQIQSLFAQWGAQVRQKIERAKRYPNAARGVSGTVHVRITVDRNGTLRGVSVTGSSGNAALDSAALQAIKSARRFPSAPRQLTDPSYTFTLAMRFST